MVTVAKYSSFSNCRYVFVLLKYLVLFGATCPFIDEHFHSNRQLRIHEILSTDLGFCTGNLPLDF